jgi:hypothetical protein
MGPKVSMTMGGVPAPGQVSLVVRVEVLSRLSG